MTYWMEKYGKINISIKIPVLLIIIMILHIVCTTPTFSEGTHLLINEFMASNTTTIQDEDGDNPD